MLAWIFFVNALLYSGAFAMLDKYAQNKNTYTAQELRMLRRELSRRLIPRDFKLPDEQRLINALLRNYERAVRPVINASTTVKVKMGLTLTQIFDMDEKNQLLITNVWLDQEWFDEFLKWEPKDYNGLSTLRIPCHLIWLPDIVLYNNAADYAEGLMEAKAMVQFDGVVFWPVPTKLQSSCKVDVTYFPFDEQLCKLKFGSWTYDGFQVDITNRSSSVDLGNYVVNGEWDLLRVEVVRNVVYYACCPEPFPDVTFTVYIRRRILFYMYNVVFPCVMLSVLTLLVFCLPPDSGEKVALGITVLLAFSVFMLAVAENMPETSENIPLISIYLTVVMGMTSVSVIMTVMVLNLHHRGPRKQRVPPWVRKLLHRGEADKNDSRLVRNIALRVTLDNIQETLQHESALLRREMEQCQGVEVYQRVAPSKTSGRRLRQLQQHARTHQEILHTLREMMWRQEQEDSEELIREEWRRLAVYVDKILFWVFLTGTVASTSTILVILPVIKSFTTSL